MQNIDARIKRNRIKTSFVRYRPLSLCLDVCRLHNNIDTRQCFAISGIFDNT